MIFIKFTLMQLYSFIKNQNGSISKIDGSDLSYDVVVNYDDQNATSALYNLVVNTSNNIPDMQQAYMAGYAESSLTYQIIYDFYQNAMYDNDQYRTIEEQRTWDPWFYNYVEEQIIFLQLQIKNNPKDKWWHGVDLILNGWLQGMSDGYNVANPSYPLGVTEFYLLNMDGDFYDLSYWIGESDKANASRTTMNGRVHTQQRQSFSKNMRCTGAIRMNSACTDILFAHDTWQSFFGSSPRMSKTYLFNFDLGQTIHQQVAFSSYPGIFLSLDDFYIVHNQDSTGKQINLAVLETTFEIFNHSLYNQYMDKNGSAVLTWMRIQLSNLISMDGVQWNQSFGRSPSYTYNNNYLILDYNAFQSVLDQCKPESCTPSQRRDYIMNNKINLLTSVEVIPGYVKMWDATSTIVNKGFYASINAPSEELLYKLAGYQQENEEWGNTNYWSYYNAPRMCIFENQITKVETIENFQWFMRYNQWETDPCQEKDPSTGIASRMDLITNTTYQNASDMGAVDSKMTNLTLAQQFLFLFLIGPVHNDSANIPVWNFSQHPEERQPYGTWTVLPNVWTVTIGCGYGTICPVYPAVSKNDNVTIICATVIPCGVVLIGVCVWLVIYCRKKNALKLPKNEESVVDNKKGEEKQGLVQNQEGQV